MLDQGTAIYLSNLSFLSPDVVYYNFDYYTNEYTKSEDFGIFIIKPLSKALSTGDIIKVTTTNQNDITSGITQPNRETQKMVILDAYQGLNMSKMVFMEVLGTDKSLGDPLETNALGTVFNTPKNTAGPFTWDL